MADLVKSRVFQYLVLWHPTKEQSKNATDNVSKIIVESTLVLGVDDKAVGMKAIKAIPAAYDEQLDQIEVVIRPF